MQNLVKPEDDVDAAGIRLRRRSRDAAAAVVSPADPFVALAAEVLTVESEVGVADLVVRQLAKSAEQMTVADRAVVREVVEIHLRSATVALTRVVRHNTVYST